MLDALLAFLMRRDPERIMNWSLLDDLPAIRLTALFFAGLDVGRKSLPLISGSADLNRLFLSIYESVVDPKRNSIPVTFEKPNARITQLVDPEHRTLLERVTVESSLSNLVSTVNLDGRAERIASEICIEENWLECLSISIEITAKEIVLNPGTAHRIVINISGPESMPTRSVSVDMDKLIARLEDIDNSTETASMTRLRRVLEV